MLELSFGRRAAYRSEQPHLGEPSAGSSAGPSRASSFVHATEGPNAFSVAEAEQETPHSGPLNPHQRFKFWRRTCTVRIYLTHSTAWAAEALRQQIAHICHTRRGLCGRGGVHLHRSAPSRSVNEATFTREERASLKATRGMKSLAERARLLHQRDPCVRMRAMTSIVRTSWSKSPSCTRSISTMCSMLVR